MELVRYFSFSYYFFDVRLMRGKYGIWNVESAHGFPNAKDLIKDIKEHVRDYGIEIALTSWQEFQTENDYRNFTGTKYLDFHEAGAREREKMLQGK